MEGHKEGHLGGHSGGQTGGNRDDNNNNTNPNFVKAEISPSGRAECRGCKAKIEKGEVRLGICFDDGMTRSYPWHHLSCLYLTKAFIDSNLQPADVRGFNSLPQKIKLAVEDRILKLTSGEIKKERFTSNKKEKNPENEAEEEKRYKEGGYTQQERKQFKQFTEEYEKRTVKDLQVILQSNSQLKGGNKQEVLERVADGFLLGAIPLCEKCEQGHLIFNKYDGTYKCKGFFDENAGEYHQCRAKFKRDQVKRGQFS